MAASLPAQRAACVLLHCLYAFCSLVISFSSSRVEAAFSRGTSESRGKLLPHTSAQNLFTPEASINNSIRIIAGRHNLLMFFRKKDGASHEQEKTGASRSLPMIKDVKNTRGRVINKDTEASIDCYRLLVSASAIAAIASVRLYLQNRFKGISFLLSRVN